MIVFDLVGNYRWDAKVVLVLAAFATSYGEFWLIMQLYPRNLLAVSVAMLKQLPCNVSMLKPRFKALSLLVKEMVEVTKCIIEFEGLPIAHLMMDKEMISTTKSHIFIAAYWVIRSSLNCSSHINDLIAMKSEQVHVLSLQWVLIFCDFFLISIMKFCQVTEHSTNQLMFDGLINFIHVPTK